MDLSALLRPVVEAASEHAERVDAEGMFPGRGRRRAAGERTARPGVADRGRRPGAGPVEFTEVIGELAAACGSTAMIYLMHVSAAVAVAAAPPAAPPISAVRLGEWRRAGDAGIQREGVAVAFLGSGLDRHIGR